MKNREYSFDFFRGIAILGVIAIHASGLGIIFSDTNWNFHFSMIWRQLLNFSVPLFLFISGYFMSQYDFNKKENYINYLKKRIPRVYLPYLFWSIVIISISIIATGGVNLTESLIELLTFSASGSYYFIALIIQFYVLTQWLQKFSTRKGILIVASLNILCLMILYVLRFGLDKHLTLILYAGPFFMWWIFYQLGLYYGVNKENPLIDREYCKILIFFTFLLSIGESYITYYLTNDISNAVSAVKISSFLYSFFIINFFFINRTKFDDQKSFAINIGKASFGIYLIHTIILGFLMGVLKRIDIILNNQILFQTIAIIGTIIICMLIIWLSRKIFPERVWKKWFGF